MRALIRLQRPEIMKQNLLILLSVLKNAAHSYVENAYLALSSWRFMLSWQQCALAFRLARRELRSGFRGFWIFLACIMLGVTAIAGVSSVSRSLVAGLGKEGRMLLGGDLSFSLLQRAPKQEEIDALKEIGRTASYANMRSMIMNEREETSLIELKVVDGNYPLVGELLTIPALSRSELMGFSQKDNAYGLITDPILAGRLQIAVGDKVRIGDAWFILRAIIDDEPDRIGSGFSFAPRVMISREALDSTGLIQPGSIIRWTIAVILPDDQADEAHLDYLSDQFKKRFSDIGWNSRTRLKASPGFENGLERFTQFLTLVGLTALLVGGVGVANAVSAFIERKRKSVASLKSQGASGQFVVCVYLLQILLIAAIGIILGLLLGAAIPFILAKSLESLLPVPVTPVLATGELVLAAFYGILITIAFSVLPLGRAHDMPVTSLFRDQVEENNVPIRSEYRFIAYCAVFLLVMVSLISSYDRKIGIVFLIAIAFAFLILRGAAKAIMELARRVPSIRNARLRFAVSNLYRPGSITPSLVLSLGLGISLLTTLAVVDSNLNRQLTQAIAHRAPSFFFLDVSNNQYSAFQNLMNKIAPEGTLDNVPMMTGRILEVNGVSTSRLKVDPRTQGILNGDRGVTFSATLPEGSRLSSGRWWPEDYKGEPLVSFEEQFGNNLGLKIGDYVEISVMGMPFRAKVANFRRVDWTTLSINFFMVFTPSSFENVSHSRLVTITFPETPSAQFEASIAREVATYFPHVTSIRVKEALEAANQMFGQMIFAIRGASSIVLIASFLVLAGALAASQGTRLRESIILKTLGATRRTLISIYVMEYFLIGLATAVFGMIAGTVISWVIVSSIMKLEFFFLLKEAFLAAFLAVIIAILLGLAGTWRILNQKPAAYLREL